MSEIRTVDGLTPPSHRSVGFVLRAPASEEGGLAVEDRIEISDLAQILGTIAPDPEIRTEKVASVRAALARGDYLTSDKLAVAVQAALKEIGLEDHQ